MASAGDADGGVGTATKKKKRISDCLGDSDGDEAAAAASPPPPGTPRLRLPGFTCARLRFVRLGRKRAGAGAGGRKEVAAEKSEAASVDSSGWRPAASANGSGGAASEAGVAASLLFFLAKTSVELKKMAEVRAEMEALLKKMRGGQAKSKRHTDHLVVPRACSLEPPPPWTTTTASSSRASGTDTNGLAASSSAMEMASSGSERACEAEDETEPGRCQLNCSTEQQTSESSDDEFIELEGGFGFRRGRRWDEECGGGGGGGGGVEAAELERRLHEVLHERNRGRIAELEAALRRAERKLVEKEMEARLWKDTAKLALQPQGEPGASQHR